MMTVTLPASGFTLAVRSLKEASIAITTARDALCMGATEFYSTRGVGKVRDAEGTHVATISYNGRVWSPKEVEIVVPGLKV